MQVTAKTIAEKLQLSCQHRWVSGIVALLVALCAAPALSANCDMSSGLAGPIVECVEEPLEQAATALLTAMYTALEPAIAAFLLLAVVGFGLKMAAGNVRRILPETGIATLKLASVIVVIQSFPSWYPLILDAMEGLLLIVTEPLLQGVMTCPATMLSDPGNIWARVDCILGAMFGLGAMTTGAGVMVGLLAESIGQAMGFTDIGVMIAMAGFGMAVTLILAVARSIIGFLCAKIVICFLIGLAPLFMPLIMLRGTYGYFDKWVKNLLSYVLQPIFLFAYLSLSLTMIDYAVFRGQYSVATVLIGRPATSMEDFQTEMARSQEGRTCTQYQDVGLIQSIPDFAQCETIFQQMGQGAGTTVASETVTQMCGQMEDFLFGAMRQLEGAAHVGVSISGALCDDQMAPFLLIQLAVVFMIAILMFMFAEVVPDMARDLAFSPRIARMGALEVPGESVVAGIASPERMGDIFNSFGVGQR